MTIELNFTYAIDGFFDSVNYYRSETPMDPEFMPVATATGITGLTYTDTTATKGLYYFVRFGSVKGTTEKISDEIKVLAGTAWTPANLSTAPKIWIDADHVTKDGSDYISQAEDLSGNNYHFTQITSGYRPQQQTDSTLNTKAIVFNGVDQSIQSVAAKPLLRNVGAGYSFAIVKKNASQSSDTVLLAVTCGVAKSRFTTSLSNSGFTDRRGIFAARLDSDSEAGIRDSIAADTSWHLDYAEISYTGGTAARIIDSVVTASSSSFTTTGNTSDTDSVNPVSIGCWTGPTNVSHANMSLIAMIVGNTLPTSDEREKLEGWAAHKYGLTANLPSGHPYKTLVPTV